MVRISGVDLPKGKRAEIALTYIYGIGRALSSEMLRRAGVDLSKNIDTLTEHEVVAIRDVIKDYKVEGDLRKDVSMNIKRLIDIGSYRGLRHKRNLPVRGQRTKTNARTRKGKRKTVGVMRKEVKATMEKKD